MITPYNYNVSLVRAVDGDTMIVVVDLGFSVSMNLTFRLYGIDAPEPKGLTKPLGLASKLFLESLLSQGPLMIRSEKPITTDKYGRWLAIVYVNLPDGTVINVNDEMIKSGHAVARTY